MTLFLVWQLGRSTASGQRILLGVFSSKEAAQTVVNEGDRTMTETTLDQMIGVVTP